MGFVAMSLLYAVLGVILAYAPGVNKWIPTGIYGLTFFFSNFGPNATTFILPSEVFPTEIRARCHGISAAAGKLGMCVQICHDLPSHNPRVVYCTFNNQPFPTNNVTMRSHSLPSYFDYL